MKFTHKEMTSNFFLKVVICACLNDGNCTLDGVLSSGESTVIMNCECLQGMQV